MKNLLFFFCFAIVSSFTSAQVKILFDASKAETAGNADWIIDADQYNLNYYSNGTANIGGGNEANAQRIPTPAQSGITASTSETYWNGGLSNWAVDCVKKGYTVETLPYNGAITYGNAGNAQDLTNYKVFIVCEPNFVFTLAEKQAILSFVQNGGGLFMVADHTMSDRNGDGWDSPNIWNDLMSNNGVQSNPFGITFDLVDFTQTTSNLVSTDSVVNGPMGAVTQMMFNGGTTMTLSTAANPTVKGFVFKTGSSTSGSTNVMMARARYGNGRVVALGDSSPCDDGTGDPNDNLYNGYTGDVGVNHQRIIMNATIWLAGAGVVTGINDVTNVNDDVFVSPNPAVQQTYLSYSLSGNTKVAARLLDISGRPIRNLFDRQQTAGNYQYKVDLSSLQAGVYLIELRTGNRIATKKLLIH
jgi:hypothetical protein